MAALRIVPTGLAMPWPAISGAEPWIGSYSPEVGLKEVEGTDGGPANEAEGRRPREPGITLDWSDRLHGSKSCSVGQIDAWWDTHMSPNKFSVKITPFSFLGSDTISMAAESTK